MSVILIPCINGATLKAHLPFKRKDSTFYAMFDMFIPAESTLESIKKELINRLILDHFLIDDENTRKDIDKYTKAIFYNLKQCVVGENSASTDVAIYDKTELNVSKQVISYISEKQFSETFFSLNAEIVIPVGNRPEVSKYSNLLVLILSRIDIESISSVAKIDTDLVFRIRVTIDPNDKILRERSFEVITKKLYDEFQASVEDAHEILKELLGNENMIGILNQLFERYHGFTIIKNVKRVDDKDFEKLMAFINEFQSMRTRKYE